MDSTILIAVVTLVVAIAGILAFLFLTQTKSNGNTLILTGEMTSGKTALYYRIQSDRFVETVPSMAANKSPISSNTNTQGIANKDITIYDIPGHGSFQSLLQEELPHARAIIFAVDSTSLSSLPAAALSLYRLLTNSIIVSSKIPIILCATKTDLAQHSLPITRITQEMEGEIEKIRKAHANIKTLDSIGAGEVQKTIPLAEPFKFSSTSPTPTLVTTSSAKDGKMSELYSAIKSVV